MEEFQVQDLIQICEELGISAGSEKARKAILDVMRAEDVTIEEADEAWEMILERKLEAKERERRERRQLEGKEHESPEETARRERRREIQIWAWRTARYHLHNFKAGESIVTFLADFEKVCEKEGVNRDLWSERLILLLPRRLSCVLEHLLDAENRHYDEGKMALLRHFDALSQADCEGQVDSDNAELVKDRPPIEMAASSGCMGNAVAPILPALSDEREHTVVSPSREAALQTVADSGPFDLDSSDKIQSVEERPQGEPASADGVGCSHVLSKAQTSSDDHEPSLVLPHGAISLRREGSVPTSTRAETTSPVSRAEGKRRRRKPRKSDSGGDTSRVKRANRQHVGKKRSRVNPRLRRLLRSIIGVTRICKGRISRKFRRRKCRRFTAMSRSCKQRNVAKHLVCLIVCFNCHSLPGGKTGDCPAVKGTACTRVRECVTVAVFGGHGSKVAGASDISAWFWCREWTTSRAENGRPARARLKGRVCEHHAF